jgi:signal transduction histidine kinase
MIQRLRGWRYVGGLAVPALLWLLFIYVLGDALRARLRGAEEYDESVLREWVEESRVFRETLPEMVRDYLDDADHGRTDIKDTEEQQIAEQLRSLGKPTKMYQNQLPLFPAIYRLELEFPHHPKLPPIVWESGVPRPRQAGQVRRLDHPILGKKDGRAILHFEYQLHAYNKRQRDERLADIRLRWLGGLTIAATALALLWIIRVQQQQRERDRQREQARQQIELAERALLEGELRRQEAERKSEETERDLLKQRLATQVAEQHALELKSQLYASIGIMAGSYAHNIKNLLVRPNDLLSRCMEANGLSNEQDHMLREVRDTLGTVTQRLQEILRTVRRDPHHSELERIDLNALTAEIAHTWQDLARDKWKMTLTTDLTSEPLWVKGDRSHLLQAIENLLFNARDATFEKRSSLREEARRSVGTGAHADAALRQALIDAAAWRGSAMLRTRHDGDKAILEVEDNGAGMTEDVRRRCTETHFSTKRDNAIYEGNSTGMGLGLSFVVVVLDNHRAILDIESQPMRGTRFRLTFPQVQEEPAAETR